MAGICALLPAQNSQPLEDEKRPKEPPPQPIPFSHKAHVAQGIKCRDCHSIRDPGFAAGIPSVAVCMGCHSSIRKDRPAIQKLAEFAKSKTPIPWARVYTLPDYVWFSHALHTGEAKLACDACHGPVASRDAVFKEKPTNMSSCIACHANRGASIGCDICHSTR